MARFAPKLPIIMLVTAPKALDMASYTAFVVGSRSELKQLE